MMTRPFGGSGRAVSAIGLGGMPLSIDGRPVEPDAIAVVHAAIDAGVTFIDTADVYCTSHLDIGHNERLIAQALRTHRRGGEVLVATKGGLERPDGAWTRNGRPKHLLKACEASLKALGVEIIEVYQLHAPDPDVPLDESVGMLAELRGRGLIRHVGLSNVSVAELEQSLAIVPIVSVQNRCNPFDREAFTDGVVAACEAHGVAFLPYSPVGGHRGRARTPDNAALKAVGQDLGASPYEVCIAWLLAKSPGIIPIPGASRPASIRSSAGAVDLELSDEHLADLDAAFPTAQER